MIPAGAESSSEDGAEDMFLSVPSSPVALDVAEAAQKAVTEMEEDFAQEAEELAVLAEEVRKILEAEEDTVGSQSQMTEDDWMWERDLWCCVENNRTAEEDERALMDFVLDLNEAEVVSPTPSEEVVLLDE